MTILHVQDNSSSSSTASVSVTLSSHPTTGNSLFGVVCLPVYGYVISVTDNLGGRWIQNASSYSASGGAEIWSARGVRNGATTVVATVSSSGSVGFNVSEFSGVWWANPLDTWSQNVGLSESAQGTTVTPRMSGDLSIAAVASGAPIDSTPGAYTVLSMPGNAGYGAVYKIKTNANAERTNWMTSASSTYATCDALFVPGVSGVNPLMQFPEVSVELGAVNDYLAPFNGNGVWSNITQYVETMALGPIGRQHELDRVQSSPATITVTNRDGSFNAWNTGSFLYPNGLVPMCPVRVIAAWNGITSPVYYGYAQSFTPHIADALNVDLDIGCYDILQNMSLAYLANNNYAQAVLSGE